LILVAPSLVDSRGSISKELSHNKGKVNHGNDNTTKAHLVNPVIAKIPLLPIGRFDEMLKASEQALSL